jgi:putative flippase GtrA
VTDAPFLRSFPRSALTSVLTTSLDFGVLAALVELAHANYVLATFIGTVVGATSNFLINRWWAFAATGGHPGGQAARYVAVQAGSSSIHTAGVWLLTRFAGTRYLIAKVVVSMFAYLVWNYPLNHYFVFPAHQRG